VKTTREGRFHRRGLKRKPHLTGKKKKTTINSMKKRNGRREARFKGKVVGENPADLSELKRDVRAEVKKFPFRVLEDVKR